MTKWILVSSGWLPEFDKTVLVTIRLHYDKSLRVCKANRRMGDIFNGGRTWSIHEEVPIGWDILAWMPLPEPYIESEDNE